MIASSSRPIMRQLTRVPWSMDTSCMISLEAHSTAAAAMDDGQWSKNSVSWIVANVTWVAWWINSLMCLPFGSTLSANKYMKVKGVIDRSLQSSASRTRSSIRKIVRCSNMYLASSICKSRMDGTRVSSILAARERQVTASSCIAHPLPCSFTW